MTLVSGVVPTSHCAWLHLITSWCPHAEVQWQDSSPPTHPHGHFLAVFTLKSLTLLKNLSRHRDLPLISLKVTALAFSKEPLPGQCSLSMEHTGHAGEFSLPGPTFTGEREKHTPKRQLRKGSLQFTL